MVTVTLFVPCIANVFMIWKERGTRAAAVTVAAVFATAFLVGGLVRAVLALGGPG
jgi:ferrous iron transport protein B